MTGLCPTRIHVAVQLAFFFCINKEHLNQNWLELNWYTGMDLPFLYEYILMNTPTTQTHGHTQIMSNDGFCQCS